jgi:hypothetical protein
MGMADDIVSAQQDVTPGMCCMQLIDKKIRDLTEDAPDLPDFSAFHPAFKEAGPNQTPDGDMRTAFFLYALYSMRQLPFISQFYSPQHMKS